MSRTGGAESAQPAGPFLAARDVHKTYQLGRIGVKVLKGATLTIERGEWVAILGASGSGKSTLLHLLGDLDRGDADGDEVLHLGRTLASMSPLECNRYRNAVVGFVFQFYHLLPELTVLENTLLPAMVAQTLKSGWRWVAIAAIGAVIGAAVGVAGAALLAPESSASIFLGAALGAPAGCGVMLIAAIELATLRTTWGAGHRENRARAVAILESFGLGHRLRHRPRELSGGERQRVAIARALLNDPEILLADEPTGNLDQRTGSEILDLIAAHRREGMTIVMVTHDPAIAARADRIVRLRDGRVEEESSGR